MASLANTAGAGATRTRPNGRRRNGMILPRVISGVIILFVVSIIVFFTTQALPGDLPRLILGVDATPDQVDALRVQLGLDRPPLVQYAEWITGVLRGDWGTSLVNGRPVADVVGFRVLNSFALIIIAMLIAIPLSFVLGVLAAARRDRATDHALFGVSVVVNALPDFVLGTLLVALFGTTVFRIFPPVALIPVGDLPWWHPASLVLPVMTIVLMATTYLYRLVRASMLDVLDSDYVQTATLKGLSRTRILFRHALPNAVVPAVQASSLVFAVSLGGLVVIEYLFGYPGLGTLLADSIATHDLPVLQAVILIIAATFFICNLIADVISARFGTRTRNR